MIGSYCYKFLVIFIFYSIFVIYNIFKVKFSMCEDGFVCFMVIFVSDIKVFIIFVEVVFIFYDKFMCLKKFIMRMFFIMIFRLNLIKV